MARLTGGDGAIERVFSSRQLGRLAAVLVGVAGLTGLGDGLLVAAHHGTASEPHFRPAVVWGVCAAAVFSMVVLFLRPRLVSVRSAPFLIVATSLGVTVAAYGAGPRGAPFATIFYVWAGSAFVFLPPRAAAAEVAVTGVLHGVLLAVQPGHPAALAEGLFTFGITVLTALVVSRIVSTLVKLARAERAARAEAETGKAAVERISARKTEFLTRTNHEVRNPLNAIIGFADMLGDGLVGDLNPQQADYVEEVRTSGRHLLDLMGDAFDVTKVELGRDELNPAPFSLDELLAGAVALFRAEAERRGITITLAGRRRVAEVVGDERKIRQVVLNLLSNAVKFTPVGGRVVVTGTVHDDFAQVAVADNGPGIAPEDIDRIFEEYRQVSRGADPAAGTGLGLPLARRFAELHGGTLEIQTQVGSGSTFTLRIPVGGPTAPSVDASVDLDSAPRTASRWVPFEIDLTSQVLPLPGILAVGGSVLGLITMLIQLAHPSAVVRRQYHPVPLVALAGVAMVTGALSRRPGVLNARRVGVMFLVGTAGFTLAQYWVGPALAPYGAMLYVWVGISAVTYLKRRQAIAHITLVGIAYAALLVVQTGNVDPVARWLTVMAVVTLSAAGVEWLLAVTSHIATAEHRARLEVERVRTELLAANRHKSEFLATMSHELRTPLNAIIGFSEVLADELFGPLTAKQSEYAADLTDSGRQLLALVNDILDLAKMDAGRMDLELDDGVDVADVIRTASALAVPHAHVDLGTQPPAMRVDRRKLHRIVGNLVLELAADGTSPVGVTVHGATDALVVDVRSTRPRERPWSSEDVGPPLRIAVAAGLAEMHRGTVEPLVDGCGWRLTIPRPPASDRTDQRETV